MNLVLSGLGLRARLLAGRQQGPPFCLLAPSARTRARTCGTSSTPNPPLTGGLSDSSLGGISLTPTKGSSLHHPELSLHRGPLMGHLHSICKVPSAR